MRRNVLIVLGVVVLAWGVAAIVLGSPDLKLFASSSSELAGGRLAAVPALGARAARPRWPAPASTSRRRPGA